MKKKYFLVLIVASLYLFSCKGAEENKPKIKKKPVEIVYSDNIQDTFFGVKFGASKQEITNTFEKQGFIVPGTGYDDFLLFFPPETKEYMSFCKHDWEYGEVHLSNSKFYAIVFHRYFKSKESALKNYNLALSKLSSLYQMNEIPINDVEAKEKFLKSHFVILDDLTNVYLTCRKEENENGKIEYVVDLSYENTNYVSIDSETIVTVVEEPAMFPGGVEALITFLSKNVTYPQEARETGTQGIVYVTFVVEKDGSISDIKILQDIGAGCGEEAVRVVKAMPKWIPAKHKGEKVRMQFNLPIKFSFAE